LFHNNRETSKFLSNEYTNANLVAGRIFEAILSFVENIARPLAHSSNNIERIASGFYDMQQSFLLIQKMNGLCP